MPWRLPAWVALILPLAVTENRFLQDDFVLSLGISLSFRCNKRPPWHALYRPGGSRTGGLIAEPAETMQAGCYRRRRSRQAIERPARITSATPMKVLRCGTSLKNRKPQRIAHGSAVYSNSAASLASARRYPCARQQTPIEATTPQA